MLFKAWYLDQVYTGYTWDDFKSLPESGVIWITVFRSTGRTFYNGGDWYYLENGDLKYVPSGPWGTWQPKPPVSCRSCVKQGVGVSDSEFQMIREMAMKDMGD